ncbi:MAG: hypothetical protein ACRD5R_11155 [Candidatus Acidiferrales bacterium]
MRFRILAFLICMAMLPRAVAARSASPQHEKKDYLTDAEADKIRDAMDPGDRIRLFISFAADRMKKFQYELAHAPSDAHKIDVLNSLLNAYVGCVDDAADQIEVARDKQLDIRGVLKEFDSKGKGFLAELQKLDANSPDYDSYQDTLQDAVEGTKDDLSDVESALKQLSPEPVRRKPS